MKGKILRINKTQKIIAIHFIALIFLCTVKINFSNVKILQDDFIITFMLSIIGIFLAIITLLYGLIDKIATVFSNNNISISMYKIFRSLDELKDNTMFIVYVLIFNFILGIIANIDIPYFSFADYSNKINFIYSLKLVTLSLVLYAIYDTIKAFFLLLNISRN
ncbi:TPA: hypothetical protein LA462_002764 [Clostridium botulinum]|nr:hypothetical protein [Clostridium botulinum]